MTNTITNPCLHVDLDTIRNNASVLASLGHKRGVEIMGVAKGCSAMPEVARAMVDGGLRTLGDARVKNLADMRQAGIQAEFMLLRPAMFSEAEQTVRLARRSLVTTEATAQALAHAAHKQGLVHEVIIMVELGDLREGVMPADLPGLAQAVHGMKGIRLVGLGGNFNCVCGLMPTPEKLEELAGFARQVQADTGCEMELTSGGSTSALKLLVDDTMPAAINHLRVGAALLVGFDDIRDEDIEGLRRDAFILSAEIIEITEKPSVPWGELGRNAFLESRSCEDRGIRRRALLSVGRQDVHPGHLSPLLSDILIMDASSDHLLVDITDAQEELHVGDEMRFRPSYPGILSLTTSPYVHKRIVNSGRVK